MRNTSRWFEVLIFAVALAVAAPVIADEPSSPSPPSDRAQASNYNVGVDAVHAGDYQRALASLQMVVQADPGNADAWNYIGFSERNLRHYNESLDAYRKALAINPEHRGANEYLGELYLKTGDLDKARGQLARLQSLCPGGCPEYDDLNEAVGAYRTAQKQP